MAPISSAGRACKAALRLALDAWPITFMVLTVALAGLYAGGCGYTRPTPPPAPPVEGGMWPPSWLRGGGGTAAAGNDYAILGWIAGVMSLIAFFGFLASVYIPSARLRMTAIAAIGLAVAAWGLKLMLDTYLWAFGLLLFIGLVVGAGLYLMGKLPAVERFLGRDLNRDGKIGGKGGGK